MSQPRGTTPADFRISRPTPVFDYKPLRTSLDVPGAWSDPHMPLDVSNLPPLPLINDPKLAKQAITHRSTFTDALEHDPLLMHQQIQHHSYEPLALSGDKYMADCAGQALERRFPEMPPSQVVDLTEMLLSNRTISYISFGYKFEERLRFGNTVPGSTAYTNQKVCADLLAAHIGGLYKDLGQEGSDRCIRDWLFEVFSSRVFRTLEEVVERWKVEFLEHPDQTRTKERKTVSQAPSPSSQCLNTEPRRIAIEFQEIQPRLWHARVTADSKAEGCASGLTKVDAQNRSISSAIDRGRSSEK